MRKRAWYINWIIKRKNCGIFWKKRIIGVEGCQIRQLLQCTWLGRDPVPSLVYITNLLPRFPGSTYDFCMFCHSGISTRDFWDGYLLGDLHMQVGVLHMWGGDSICKVKTPWWRLCMMEEISIVTTEISVYRCKQELYTGTGSRLLSHYA